MIHSSNSRIYFYATALSLVILCCLAGCTKHNYKAEADEQVYGIIDRKWKDEFGTKANYKISDVTPEPNDVQIEKAVPSGGVLTLAQAVAMATAHNRDYQTQKEQLYTAALDLRLTRHQFEMQYFGGFSGGYGSDWNDSMTGVEANLGFNRLLTTGTMITTRLSGAYVDVLTGNMRSGLASILSATVTQPLLRGSDPRVVMEGLTQAERDTLYQVRLFARFRQTFVVSVVTQYYEALRLSAAIRNAQANTDALSQLSYRVEKLADAGRLPASELDEVRQEIILAEDARVQAQKEYELLLDQIKIMLALPATAEFQLDPAALDDLRKTGAAPIDFNEPESIQAAITRRLDVINRADAVLDAQRKVYVAADALGAELNLTGSADVVSGRRGNRRNVQLTEDYLLDLELNLPLDRVAEQNVYRKALIALNQRQREYDLGSDTVALEVRQAYRDLTEAAERYRLQSEGLKLARERLRKTNALIQYARASSRRVLDAQRDLFNAQNEADQALVNYATAMLNFYRDTGVLQIRPDGMWKL